MKRESARSEFGARRVTLLFSPIQQLWDRSDPDGYAWQMTTDPYPGAAFNAFAPAANTPPVESGANQDPHAGPRRRRMRSQIT